MFNENKYDRNADYLHKYFFDLITNCCQPADVKDNTELEELLQRLKFVFYNSRSQKELKTHFTQISEIVAKHGVKEESLLNKFNLFMSMLDRDPTNPVDQSFYVIEKNKEDIKSIALWSIYFNQLAYFNVAIKSDQNHNKLDQSIIDTILCNGTLTMFCNYVPDEMITQIQIDENQKNEIKNLELLKFLINRGVIDQMDLDNLSLCTATEEQNLPLLSYLVDEIKAQNHHKNRWATSAFFEAIEYRNEAISLKLVTSGAFNLSKEFTSVLEDLDKIINNPSDDDSDDENDKEYHQITSIREYRSKANGIIKMFAKDDHYRNELITVINAMQQKPLVPRMQEYLKSFLTKIEKVSSNENKQQTIPTDKSSLRIDPKDCVKFISDRLIYTANENSIQKLAKLLDYLQPAIVSACDYINNRFLKVDDYIEFFKTKSYIIQAQYLKSFQAWREELPKEDKAKDELSLLSNFMAKH